MENQPDNVSVDPYVQEHIDLVTAIRTGKPFNEAGKYCYFNNGCNNGTYFSLYRKRDNIGRDDELRPETRSKSI